MAASTVRELITKWGFKVDDKPLKQMEQGINNVKQGLIAVGAATAAIGGALFALAKTTATYGDHVAKTSKQLGINAQALQEIGYAAEISGASQEELENGLKRFSRTVEEARDGLETYTDIFKKLGISSDVYKDKNLKTEEFLSIIADRFKTLEDPIQKTALAQELFGRAGAKLIPLLDEGAAGIEKLRKEARALGFVMGDEDLAAAEEFNDQMLRIKVTIQGFGRILGSQIIPVINELATEFLEWAKANREVIKENLNEFFEESVKIFKQLLTVFKYVYDILVALAAPFGGLGNAVRLLTQAFVIFFGLKIAVGIGQIVQGFYTFIKTVRLAGTAAAIAQAKMLLLPLAITAIIVALALLVDDFIAFTEGRDSVIGRFIDSLDFLVEQVTKKFEGLNQVFKAFIVGLLLPFRALQNALRNVVDIIAVVKGELDFDTFLNRAGKRFKNTLTGGLEKDSTGQGKSTLDEAFGLDEGELKQIFGDFKKGARGAFPLNETTKQELIRSQQNPSNIPGTGARPIIPEVNNQVTINVEGLPPETAQKFAEEGIKQSLERMLRETGRQLQPEVER